MAKLNMGELEGKFADIIWENEPISSAELARRALEAFNWKKTTSYTVLKRLCDKGLFQNVKGTVTSVIKKPEYNTLCSQQFIELAFKGSLPSFIAAYARRKPLKEEDIECLRELVAKYESKKKK